MILSFLISMAMAFDPHYYCVTQVGDLPKIKFRGRIHEDTMYKSVKMCLSMRIQNYMTQRLHQPSEERMITFMEDCVNHTHCKHPDVKGALEDMGILGKEEK